MVATLWSAPYEWHAHRNHAITAGLEQSVSNAIEAGQRPAKLSGDETLVYDLVAELLRDKDISDATFAAAKARFGERMMVELIGTVGYYGFVSLVLNADRTPVTVGGEQLPAT